MSADSYWYIQCKKCKEKIRIARLYHYPRIEFDEIEGLKEFIMEHIWYNNGKCCNVEHYDNDALFVNNDLEVGFEIIKEN